MTPPLTPSLLDWADVAAVAVLMHLVTPFPRSGLLAEVLAKRDEPLGQWWRYHAVIAAALREAAESWPAPANLHRCLRANSGAC